MPNQTDPNKTSQTQDQSVTANPPVAPVTDLSQIPTGATMPDFQNAMTDIPPMPEDATTLPTESPIIPGSAAPSDLPPVISPSPKKKFGGGKIIATILGLLLLLGGVGTGVYLTRQNQNAVRPLANILECFPAGTKISLSNGEKKNIESLQEGDVVISENEQGNVSPSSVTKLLKLWSFSMSSIVFENGENLKVTPPHPLFTKDGWKAIDVKGAKFHNPELPIGQLSVGDFIKKEDESWNQISSISTSYGLFRVYNLSVDTNHNFFAKGFLAHNKGGTTIKNSPDKTTVLDEAHNNRVVKEIDRTAGTVTNFTYRNDTSTVPSSSTTTSLYNLQNDPKNCGQNGHACGAGEGCGNGVCVNLQSLAIACKSGSTQACTQLCNGTAPAAEGTCVPPNTGCTTASADLNGTPCTKWHWTNCIGGGTNGVGCGTGGEKKTTTNEGGGGPTPTPGAGVSCQNIKAYSTAWVLLTSTQLSQLGVGSQVNFCVLGTADSGVFDMARFTINGVLKPDTATKRPGTNDLCQNFAIPAATTTFNVNAQIHHTTLGWK
jgi:hypothetical protein